MDYTNCKQVVKNIINNSSINNYEEEEMYNCSVNNNIKNILTSELYDYEPFYFEIPRISDWTHTVVKVMCQWMSARGCRSSPR